MAETIEYIYIWDCDFFCPCGNNSHGQGAYYCDSDGNELDGPASDDDPGSWCCDRCGRIWDSWTLAVKGYRKEGYTYAKG